MGATFITMPTRSTTGPLPKVEAVDMRVPRDDQGLTPLISRPLIDAIRETLERRKQTLLFLNRRGFHTFLFCPDCGHTFTCPNCDIALTLHAAEDLLKCHHCDYTAKSAVCCPKCRGSRLRSYGAGTERVEVEVKQRFPDARIARMDSDTTSRRGDMERILRDLDCGRIDILIGTQMITKGHDFPDITLVGVIAADASLNLPDFRAAERTFQVLTQVSGRGGRGAEPGRVLIQTFNPGLYTITRAQGHDYAGFYADELPLRRQLGYPPSPGSSPCTSPACRGRRESGPSPGAAWRPAISPRWLLARRWTSSVPPNLPFPGSGGATAGNSCSGEGRYAPSTRSPKGSWGRGNATVFRSRWTWIPSVLCRRST